MKRNIAPKTVLAPLAFACAAACVSAVAEEVGRFCQISPEHFAALKASEEVRRRTEEMKVPPSDFQESVPVLSAKTFLEKFHGLPGFLREENKLHPRRAGANPFLFRIEEHKTFSETRESLIATFVSTPKHWPLMLVSVPVGTCGVFYGDHLCFIRGNVTVHIWGFNWKNFDEEPELLKIARGIDALLCGKAEFLSENSAELREIRAARELGSEQNEKNAVAEEQISGDLEQVRISVEKILASDEAKIFAEKMNLPPPDFQESVPVISAETFLEKFHGLPGFLRVGNALYSATCPGGPPFSFRVEEYENFSRARDYLIVRALFPLREGQQPASAEAVPVGTCGVSFGNGLGLCFIRGRVFVRVWAYGWKCDMSSELLKIARGIDALLCGRAEFLSENSVEFWDIRAARALDGARRERIFRRARERERAWIEKNASTEDRAAFRAGTLVRIPPGVPEYDPLDDYREWASSRRARDFFSCPMVGNGAPETDAARIDLGAFLETLRAVAGTEVLEDGFRMTLPPDAGGASFRVVFKEMEDDDDALAYLLCRTLYSKSDGNLGDFDPDGFEDCRFCVPGSSRLTFRNGRAMLACGNIYAEITASSGKAARAALIAMALETECRLREWATETKSSAGE